MLQSSIVGRHQAHRHNHVDLASRFHEPLHGLSPKLECMMLTLANTQTQTLGSKNDSRARNISSSQTLVLRQVKWPRFSYLKSGGRCTNIDLHCIILLCFIGYAHILCDVRNEKKDFVQRGSTATLAKNWPINRWSFAYMRFTHRNFLISRVLFE